MAKPKTQITVVLVAFFACALGCKQPLSWAQADAEWKGIGIGNAVMASGSGVITLELTKRVWPSANIYQEISKAQARVEGNRIYVRLFVSTTSSRPSGSFTFKVQVTKPGTYEVHYDDETRGFPLIGTANLR